MSIKDKLDYLQDTKQAIKTAIQGKGQSVSDTDTFRSYADKINAITTGGGGGSDETAKGLIEGTLTELNDTAGSITRVGGSVFYRNPNIQNVNLPNASLIMYYAFASAEKLSSVYIPQCNNIYGYAFESCHLLTGVYAPNCSSIGVYAFAYCNKLKSVDFPNVKFVDTNTFLSCSTLSQINIPLCQKISTGGFNGCKNIETISFSLCTSIDGYAFSACTSLQTVNLPVCSHLGSYVFNGCTNLTNVNTPILQETESGVFQNCTSLENIELFGLVNIAEATFMSCYSLKNVNIPNCRFISGRAFAYCSALESIDFPVCNYVYGYVFNGCQSLKSISMPALISFASSALCGMGVESIYLPRLGLVHTYGFGNCAYLQNVSLPRCSSIGYQAFSGCSALQSIYLPKVTKIYSYAFDKCSSLQVVSLPKCDYLITSCFRSCYSLSAIYLQKRPYISGNIFVSTPITTSSYLGYFGSIYVLEEDLSWFKTATNWVAFSSRMTTFIPDDPVPEGLQENGADIASATGLTITLDNCEVGDNLIAGVITRSTSPVPNGWTLVGSAPTISTSTNTQYLNIYTKVATLTTESITATQASAGRIYANIVNIKNKTPSVINEFTNIHNTNTQKELTLTKSTENEILVFAQALTAQASGAFNVSGDYDDYYAYGDAGRLLMVQSTEEVGSQIIITHNSTGDIQWATIGIELV